MDHPPPMDRPGAPHGQLHYEFSLLRAQIRIQTFQLLFGYVIINAVTLGLLMAIFKYA